MGLIERIFGKPRLTAESARGIATIEAAEVALKAVAAEELEAQAKISTLASRRRDLLLADDAETAVHDLDREAEEARVIIERCELIRPMILARVAEIRTAARNRRWGEIRAEREVAEREYVAAVRGAAKILARLTEIWDRAGADGFAVEARGVFIFPPIVVNDQAALDRFEAAVEGVAGAGRGVNPTPKPAPQPAPRKTTPPAKKAPAPAPAAEPILRRPEPIVPATNAAGQVRIVLLKPGFEIDGKTRPVGFETWMEPAAAKELLRSTVAEYVAVASPDGQHFGGR